MAGRRQKMWLGYYAFKSADSFVTGDKALDNPESLIRNSSRMKPRISLRKISAVRTNVCCNFSDINILNSSQDVSSKAKGWSQEKIQHWRSLFGNLLILSFYPLHSLSKDLAELQISDNTSVRLPVLEEARQSMSRNSWLRALKYIQSKNRPNTK